MTTTAATGVLANDSDANGLPLTAALAPGGGPSHGTLTLNSNGSFTYTPTLGFAGADTFSYIASDSVASSAPTLVWYASTEPQILWQAGGATALFVGALGSFGYLTNRDLSGIRRFSFIGLLILLVAGVVLIFVRIPHASLIWAVLGLVVFAGLTAADFQRLRRSQGLDSAPLIAASIFLDILNIFWFFLRIFSGSRD